MSSPYSRTYSNRDAQPLACTQTPLATYRARPDLARACSSQREGWDAAAVDTMDALDASAERVVQLVGQVRPEQWDNPTPCTEWNVRTLVGHLIAGMQGYCELLNGAPAAKLRSMLEHQSEAVGADPVTTCKGGGRPHRALASGRRGRPLLLDRGREGPTGYRDASCWSRHYRACPDCRGARCPCSGSCARARSSE